MVSTTNFENWLSENEPETFDEAYALHQACGGCDCGIYTVSSSHNGAVIIKGPNGDTLVLASNKASRAFEKLIERRFKPDHEMSWEAEAAFHRAMERDD